MTSTVDTSRTKNWLRPAKELLKHTIGIVPLFDWKLKLTRPFETLRMRQFEDLEVQRLLRELPVLPVTEVVTIIPTYQRPELLLQAVESALAQDFLDHHVVVVADGCELPELPNDDRLTAVELSRNTGIAGVARNVGIRISRSTFLAFLDDDNTWELNHISTCMQGLESGADLVYTDIERVDDSGKTIDVLEEDFSRDGMRSHSIVDMNAMVVRRSPAVKFSRVPRRFGEFPKEDWELVWRLSRKYKPVRIPITTVRYVIHSGSHYNAW